MIHNNIWNHLTVYKLIGMLNRIMSVKYQFLRLQLCVKNWPQACLKMLSRKCVYKSYYHHHVALSARIFLTLFRHPSLSSIVLGWSSGLHPVSAQNYCMYDRAGRPAFDRLCEGAYRSTSLTISFLLRQQCPACLVRLILIVFVMGGRWPYSRCFVGCCLQDLFNIALSIFV